MIPPLRLGGVAIDLSFVALLLICYILLRLNRAHPARVAARLRGERAPRRATRYGSAAQQRRRGNRIRADVLAATDEDG